MFIGNFGFGSRPHPALVMMAVWSERLLSGTPCPDLARGYPITGVHPGKDMGPVKVLWDGDGVLPSHLWTNKQTETPLDAGGKMLSQFTQKQNKQESPPV